MANPNAEIGVEEVRLAVKVMLRKRDQFTKTAWLSIKKPWFLAQWAVLYLAVLVWVHDSRVVHRYDLKSLIKIHSNA